MPVHLDNGEPSEAKESMVPSGITEWRTNLKPPTSLPKQEFSVSQRLRLSVTCSNSDRNESITFRSVKGCLLAPVLKIFTGKDSRDSNHKSHKNQDPSSASLHPTSGEIKLAINNRKTYSSGWTRIAVYFSLTEKSLRVEKLGWCGDSG